MSKYFHFQWKSTPCILLLSMTVSLIPILTPVQAETKQVRLTLDSNNGQSFELLIDQAESIAKSALEQEFGSKDTTAVSIIVSGDRNGQIAPILSLNVSRSQWQSTPKIRNWTRYLNGAPEILLGFVAPRVSRSSDLATSRTNAIVSLASPETAPSFIPSPNLSQTEVAAIQADMARKEIRESQPGFRDD